MGRPRRRPAAGAGLVPPGWTAPRRTPPNGGGPWLARAPRLRRWRTSSSASVTTVGLRHVRDAQYLAWRLGEPSARHTASSSRGDRLEGTSCSRRTGSARTGASTSWTGSGDAGRRAAAPGGALTGALSASSARGRRRCPEAARALLASAGSRPSIAGPLMHGGHLAGAAGSARAATPPARSLGGRAVPRRRPRGTCACSTRWPAERR